MIVAIESSQRSYGNLVIQMSAVFYPPSLGSVFSDRVIMVSWRSSNRPLRCDLCVGRSVGRCLHDLRSLPLTCGPSDRIQIRTEVGVGFSRFGHRMLASFRIPWSRAQARIEKENPFVHMGNTM